jgi:pimeloyl-ACP methyl ester carboxylesterase
MVQRVDERSASDYPFTMREQPVSLGSIRYTDTGSGSAVFLVHGYPLDGRVWGDAGAILASSFRAIVPDLPGFGESKLNGPFTMEDLAKSLLELADALKIDRFALAGLSMGGYVGQALYRIAPKRLSGLSFVDSRANADDEAGKTGRDKMIELLEKQGTPGVVESMLPKMLHPDAYTLDPALVERQREIMQAQKPQALKYACAAMRDRPEFFSALPTLSCPLQVIVGDGDAIAPPDVAKKIADLTPGARLDVIKGAGHMSPLEKPAEVAEAMERFVAGLK